MPKWNYNCKYDPKYCQEIVDFMAEGDSLTQFAASLGTHVQTLKNWAKKNIEFDDAVKTAQAVAEAWWEKTCKKVTMGHPETYAVNDNGTVQRMYSEKLLMFTMKSRFRNYKDVLTLEVSEDRYETPPSLIPDQDDPNFATAIN